jgi:hypothetical protein
MKRILPALILFGIMISESTLSDTRSAPPLSVKQRCVLAVRSLPTKAKEVPPKIKRWLRELFSRENDRPQQDVNSSANDKGETPPSMPPSSMPPSGRPGKKSKEYQIQNAKIEQQKNAEQ